MTSWPVGGETAIEGAKGLDGLVLEGAKHEYAIPNQSIVYLRERRGVGLGAWRGLGAGYNKFVIESFIDELAAAQKADPVAFRLGLLKSNPRASRVIQAVADRSQWGKARTMKARCKKHPNFRSTIGDCHGA